MVPPVASLATIRISSTSEENAHGTEACLQKRNSGCRERAKCLAFRVSGSGCGSLGSGAFMGLDFFIGLRPLYVLIPSSEFRDFSIFKATAAAQDKEGAAPP